MSGVFQYVDPPPPSPPGECVCTPAFGAGGGQTRWVERGVHGGGGVNILEDARHSSVLYICKYFVGNSIAPWRSRFICLYLFSSSLIWCICILPFHPSQA
jgi:hypothetical protein